MATICAIWSARDQASQADIEAIRAALIEGEQSGPPQPFDGDLFKQEMIAKHGKKHA